MSWFLLLFEKHISDYLQIPSKYSNTMVSKIYVRKISMLREHENGRMLALQNDFLLHILKCTWNREIGGYLLTKISNFGHFNKKKHFL